MLEPEFIFSVILQVLYHCFSSFSSEFPDDLYRIVKLFQLNFKIRRDFKIINNKAMVEMIIFNTFHMKSCVI